MTTTVYDLDKLKADAARVQRQIETLIRRREEIKEDVLELSNEVIRSEDKLEGDRAQHRSKILELRRATAVLNSTYEEQRKIEALLKQIPNPTLVENGSQKKPPK